MSTHPVHLLNDQGKVLPTAFIPFCSFGGDDEILGQKVQRISVPICTAFKQTLFGGRKCYSLDVNDIISNTNISVSHGEKSGLSFLLDMNEDRHLGTFDLSGNRHGVTKEERSGLWEPSIHIDTLEPLEIVGGGNIALVSIKKIQGDKSYYEYARKEQICQTDEKFSACYERDFIKSLEEKCKCVPFELVSSDKVVLNSFCDLL